MSRPLQRWLVPVLLLAAVAVLCSPALLDRSLWLKDILRFTYPQKHYLRERLLSGELPMWWPEDGMGRPFFALVQPGVLYPLNVLLLLLPMPHAYDAFSAVHLGIAALGTYAWLRRSDCGESSAALGAMVFALSGYLVSLFGNNGVYVFGAAWIPAMLAVELRPTRRLVPLALLVTLCLSTGDPQAVFFAGIALVAQALGAPRAERRARVGVVICASLVAGLIGAVQLVPGLSTAAVGRAGGVPLEDASHFALHPLRLLELVWPTPFGRPNSPEWFVSPLVDEGTGGGYVPLTASLYCGLAAPLLALVALRRRRSQDVAMAVLGIVALVVAFGEHTPLWHLVFRFVPLASGFRYPEKYAMLATLALAFLAGRGHQLAIDHAPRWPVRALVIVCGVVALATQLAGARIAAWLVGTLTISPDIAGHAVRDDAARTLVVALVLWLLVEKAGKRLGPALAIVMALELLLASTQLVSWTPSDTYRERSPILDEPAIVAERGLAPLRLYRAADQQLGEEFVPALERASLRPNCGAEDGVSHSDAYSVFHTPGETALWSSLRTRPLALLQWTATSHALLRDWQVGNAPGFTLEAHYAKLGLSLLAVDGAAPRVYLAARTIVAADATAAANAMVGLVPGVDAVVEEGEARAAAGHCALTAYAPERIEIDCTSSAPSYVVLAESSFPGWHATVNDVESPVLRANAAFRAVPVASGHSRVVLRYAAPGLRVGLLLMLLGLVLAIVLRRR
ncbi:MAG: YfhO family protein [Polyangia bacterium]